jgi:molecular chaperone HtpG
VIDSPDIPLNVSRSYLQSDTSVKKITNYITRKVADKLNSIFKNERENLESKWNDIKVVIEYGMLTEDKFYDKAESFNLYPTVDDKYFTYEELEKKIKKLQTDKDGNLIILYAQNKDEQYTYIKSAKEKSYEVLLLDSPIIPHLMQKLESKKEKIKFSRVDSDTLENLIKKDEEVISKLTDEEKEKLKPMIETAVENEKFTVQLEALDSNSMPFMLAQPEFMRRMKEMQQTGGGAMGNLPDMYSLIVNTNHELVGKILNTRTEKKRNSLIKQSIDLAKLSQNNLTGKDLTEFINRSIDLIK